MQLGESLKNIHKTEELYSEYEAKNNIMDK